MGRLEGWQRRQLACCGTHTCICFDTTFIGQVLLCVQFSRQLKGVALGQPSAGFEGGCDWYYLDCLVHGACAPCLICTVLGVWMCMHVSSGYLSHGDPSIRSAVHCMYVSEGSSSVSAAHTLVGSLVWFLAMFGGSPASFKLCYVLCTCVCGGRAAAPLI